MQSVLQQALTARLNWQRQIPGYGGVPLDRGTGLHPEQQHREGPPANTLAAYRLQQDSMRSARAPVTAQRDEGPGQFCDYTRRGQEDQAAWSALQGALPVRPLFNAAALVPSLKMKGNTNTLEDVLRRGLEGQLFDVPTMHPGSRFLDANGQVPLVQPASVTEALGWGAGLQRLKQTQFQKRPLGAAYGFGNLLYDRAHSAPRDDAQAAAALVEPVGPAAVGQKLLDSLQQDPGGPVVRPHYHETDRSDAAVQRALAPLPQQLAASRPAPTAGVRAEGLQENAGNFPGQHVDPITGALRLAAPFGPVVPSTAAADAARILPQPPPAAGGAPNQLPGAAAGAPGAPGAAAAPGGMVGATGQPGSSTAPRFADAQHPFTSMYGSSGVPAPLSAPVASGAPGTSGAPAPPPASAMAAGGSAVPVAGGGATVATGGSGANAQWPGAPSAAQPGDAASKATPESSAALGAQLGADRHKRASGSDHGPHAQPMPGSEGTALPAGAPKPPPAKRGRRRSKHEATLEAVLQRILSSRQTALRDIVTRADGLLVNAELAQPLSDAERAMIRGLHHFAEAYPDVAHIPEMQSPEWRLLLRRLK